MTNYVGNVLVEDVDGDGVSEVLVTGTSACLLDGNGVPRAGWPMTPTHPISGRVIGDVTGNGQPNIVLAGTSVTVLDVSAQVQHVWLSPTILAASRRMRLADLTGNGAMDILLPSAFDVFAVDSSGTPIPGWPVSLPGNVYLELSGCADLDFDGTFEVLIHETDTSAAALVPFFVFNGDGTVAPGFPVIPSPGLRLTRPVAVDLDDGGDAEIIGSAMWGLVFYRSTGGLFETYQPISHCGGSCNLALAQIDTDPTLEVVAFGGQLTFFDIDNETIVFETSPQWYTIFHEVVVADLDGDGISELAAISGSAPIPGGGTTAMETVHVWSFQNGQLVAWPGWPRNETNVFDLNLGDLDGDGDLELVYGTSAGVQAFDLSATNAPSPPTIQWQTRDGNPQRTRFYHRPGYPHGMYLRGDVNRDNTLNVADVTPMAQYVFGLHTTSCEPQVDANGDDTIDVSDVVWLVSYLFGLGPPPEAPFPTCAPGVSTTLAPCGEYLCN